MFSKHYLDVVAKIDEGLSCNEICTALGISRKQLYYYMQSLKNDGLGFVRKYYSDGVIKYLPAKKSRDLEQSDTISLITPVGSKEETLMLISDPHYGNDRARPDLIERAYSYAKKNDIHTLVCSGDVIDGTYTLGVKERPRDEVFDQVRNFVDKFPRDDNINVIMTLGDHEYSALNTYYINLKDILYNKRHDLIVGGYNNSVLELKNDKIAVYHHINGGGIKSGYYPIILRGHTHKYTCFQRQDGTLDVNVPPLSDIREEQPSALLLDLSFKNGYIDEADVKQLLFLDKDYVVSTCRFDFKKNADKN